MNKNSVNCILIAVFVAKTGLDFGLCKLDDLWRNIGHKMM